MDFRDHRPSLNARLVELLSSGVGLRQSSRVLGLTLRCTELKARKIARHLRRLNLNLRGDLPEDTRLQFDELETYETRRNTRPLTVGWLVERDTRYLIWAESAPIRPRGRMSRQREAAIEADELRFGPRKDLSSRCVQRTLARGAALASVHKRVVVETDEKSTYPGQVEQAFGAERVQHLTTNSRVARLTFNPLFSLNHEEARVRDLMGRVRRESWLVSKKRRWLDLGMQIHMARRNLAMSRFNGEAGSPASLLGFVSRKLSIHEMLSWRQEAGRRSLHPIGRGRATVAMKAA